MDVKLANNLEQLEKLFGSRMQDYEDKLQKATALGTADAHLDLASLSHEFAEFKSFVLQTLTGIKTQLELLSLGMDRHEAAMRRKILLFHGLPEQSNENLHSTIAGVLSKQMRITEINGDNLQICHRLGSSRTKARPILVRFRDVEHRYLVWDAKTSLKGSGVTISEFLTKTRHQTFTAARKHFGVEKCWSADGRIVIILPDKSRRKIETMSELQLLMSEHPSADAGKIERVVEPSSPKDTRTVIKITEKAPRKLRDTRRRL